MFYVLTYLKASKDWTYYVVCLNASSLQEGYVPWVMRVATPNSYGEIKSLQTAQNQALHSFPLGSMVLEYLPTNWDYVKLHILGANVGVHIPAPWILWDLWWKKSHWPKQNEVLYAPQVRTPCLIINAMDDPLTVPTTPALASPAWPFWAIHFKGPQKGDAVASKSHADPNWQIFPMIPRGW